MSSRIAEQRLQSIVASAVGGNSTDVPTSLLHPWGRAEGPPNALRRQILMDDLIRAIKPSALPSYLREMEFKEVAPAIFSPLSIRPPFFQMVDGKSCSSQLDKFWEHSNALSSASYAELTKAIGRFRQRYFPARSKLRSLDYQTAFDLSDNGKFLGWPVFTSSRDVLAEVDASARRFESLAHPDVSEYWSVIGYRSERGKPYVIWQYPRALTIHEKRFQSPLLHWLRNTGPFSAWNGRESVKFSVTRMLRSDRTPLISLDYSGYDASVPRCLLDSVLNLMRECFPTSDWRLFDNLAYHFMFGGIWAPDSSGKGSLRTGRRRGVPSGSGWTNLVDSLVNLLLMEVCAVHFGVEISDSQVNGDDGLVLFSRPVGIEDLSDYVRETFGMTLSTAKSLVSDNEASYCRALYRRGNVDRNGNCRELRSLVRTCGRMMGLDNWKKDWCHELDSIRYRMQLQSCSDHPAYAGASDWLSVWDRNGYTPSSDLIAKIGEDRVRYHFPDRYAGDFRQKHIDDMLA